jgi:ethylmalonyl-CoA/methylmalonyl-CoA decarboxylase
MYLLSGHQLFRNIKSRIIHISITKAIHTIRHRHLPFLNAIANHGSGEIQFTQSGRIATILIKNPTKRNALSGRMINQFVDIIDELSSPSVSSNISVVLLRGCDSFEPSFCAGLDFDLAKDIINTPQLGYEMCNMMTDALSRFKTSNFISFALIHGYALGGGAELSTSCDYRIMTSNSTIGFVHASIGATPGWGGMQRLINIVGRDQAIHLLCTSKRLTPMDALSINLVNYVIPNNEINDYIKYTHDNYLQAYVNMPYPNVVKELKHAISKMSDMAINNGSEIEKELFLKYWASPNNISAIKKKHKK